MTTPAGAVAPDGPVADRGSFALYVHWPFCRSKCPYCDFNSHVRAEIDEERWRRALLAELDHYADLVGRRPLHSIFFGGGTPSLMAPATAGALIARAAERFGFARDIEITLEANPTSVEAGRLEAFRDAGINRVSLGVQALDAASLKFLGRGHSADEAIAAIGLARRLFERYSFDLIYARPGQDLAAWAEELDRALDLAGDHLSVYQLTIEAGTAFDTAYRRGDFVLPDDELGGALYELTQDRLGRAGMPAYEISNHARPGGQSRHNLVYWTYGDYVGIGPGAHGRLTRETGKVATRQFRAPETWLEAVGRAGHATQETTPIEPAERLQEMLMMGLRLSAGISHARAIAELGAPLPAVLDPVRLARMVEAGFIETDAAGLRATVTGRQRLNGVLAALL